MTRLSSKNASGRRSFKKKVPPDDRIVAPVPAHCIRPPLRGIVNTISVVAKRPKAQRNDSLAVIGATVVAFDACATDEAQFIQLLDRGQVPSESLLRMADAGALWAEYASSGPAFYDSSVCRADATRAWSLDLFAGGLPASSRISTGHFLCGPAAMSPLSSSGWRPLGAGQIDTRLHLYDLPPAKRAALWGYLRASGVPRLADFVGALSPHYVCVKELLESVEVFHPSVEVRVIDVVPRDSFLAQREAFGAAGTDLSNLAFEEGDLSTLAQRAGFLDADDGGRSLLLCVEGTFTN